MDLKPSGNFAGLNLLVEEDQELIIGVLEECAMQAYKLKHAQFGPRMGGSQNTDAGIVFAVDPIVPDTREMVPIKLLTNEGSGKYTFREQQPTADDQGDDDGGWEDKSIGAQYEVDNEIQYYREGECWESNKNAQVPVGSYQMAFVKYTEEHEPILRFEYCCKGSSSG